MRSIVLLSFVSFLFLSSCNISHLVDGVRGNGRMASSPRTLASFNRIVVEGSIDVQAVRSDSPQSLSINADENIVELIKTEVHDGTLRIYSDKSYSTKQRIFVAVSAQAIAGIAIEGSSNVTATGLSGSKFELHIDGSGDASLSGTAQALFVEINGSGDVRAQALESEDAQVEINGSGDVDLRASKTLRIEINGSGDVKYSGNAQIVKQEINGSGSLIKK